MPERFREVVAEFKSKTDQLGRHDVRRLRGLAHPHRMNRAASAACQLCNTRQQDEQRLRDMQARTPNAKYRGNRRKEIRQGIRIFLNVVVAEMALRPRHHKFHALEQSVYVRVALAYGTVARHYKDALLNCPNQPQNITGISRAIDHPGANDDQVAPRIGYLPGFVNELGTEFRDPVPGVRVRIGVLIGRSGNLSVHGDAAREQNFLAAYLLCICAHIPRTWQIGIKVLMKRMTRFTVDGGEIEQPLSFPLADLAPYASTHVACDVLHSGRKGPDRWLDIGKQHTAPSLVSQVRSQSHSNVSGTTKYDSVSSHMPRSGRCGVRILFNVSGSTLQSAGIRQYTVNLLRHFVNCPDIEDLQIHSGGITVNRNAITKFLTDSDHQATGTSGRLASFLRRLPGAYSARQALTDWRAATHFGRMAKRGFIYHEPNFVPVRYSGPLVLTVHDLSHLRYPEFHPKERVSWLNMHLPKAMNRADRIAADSEFTRREIIDLYNIDENKISLVHIGVTPDFHPRNAEQVEQTLRRFGLRHKGFVLSVATLEPRKNLSRLLDAYSMLPRRLRQEFPLVLVGARGWDRSSVMQKIRALQDRGEAVCTGFLARSQLVELYASAALLAYVSLYEGFGIPLVEAFSSGTAVLTSNSTSLTEVSDGAALEVDPNSKIEISDGIQRLLEDDALRHTLTQLGAARIKEFSLDRCADQAMAIYRQLAAK